MSDERPPPPPRSRDQWDRAPPAQDPIWNQLDRMWSDLKRDSAERAERAEGAATKFEQTVWKAIEKLDATKADRWVQTALAGAVTAVVMAVLMALIALVVVGKPGKSTADASMSVESAP